MARYTKVLKSLAHNAVGDRRIQAAAPAGNNYYVTGVTLGGAPNYTLSLARNGGLSDVTVNLSALSDAANPGGSDTQVQFNDGGAFGGSANLTWDDSDLAIGNSGKLKVVNGSSNYWAMYNQSNGKMRIDQGTTQRVLASSGEFQFANNIVVDGKVGIGTTSPDDLLHVLGGDVDPSIKLQNNRSGHNGHYLMEHRGSTLQLQSTGSSVVPMRFTIQNTEMMRLDDTGLGIGTTSPSYELTLSDKFMWDGNHWRANQTNGASMRNEVPSATNPVFTFNNDVDTGMGRAAANTLSFITEGRETVRLASDSNYTKLFLGGDSTLGFYRYSNRMDFYVASNPRMHLDSGKLYSATSGGPLLDLTPTTNEANYGFVDDANTGMSRTGADTLVLMTAGTTALTIDTSQVTTFANTPVVGTLAASDNSTKAASTAYVTAAVAAGGGGTIGGTISNDQVAFGASTANTIEGSSNLTFDGTTLTYTSTDAGSAAGPELDLFRNSASPAAADYIGQVRFLGESSTGVQRTYAKITGKIGDPTNAAEDGIIEMMTRKNGSNNIAVRLNESEFKIMNDTDFSVDSSVFYVDSTNDRVGIGTNTPSAKLHLMKASAGSPGYSSYANVILESDDHNYLQFSGPTNKNQGILFGDGNDNAGAVYYDHASNYMRFFTNGSEKVRIDSAGKVGIGTSAPSEALELGSGNLRLNGDSTAISIYDADGTETVRLATASGDEGLLYLRGPTGGNSIYLDGNSNSYINNGANFGIGTTSPSEHFHVQGSSDVQALFESTTGELELRFKDTSSTQYLVTEHSVLSLGAQGSVHADNLNLKAGKVGIGITSPDAPLHILKAAGGANIVTALKLDPDDTTTNSGVSIDFNASTTNTGASLVGSRIIGAREGGNASGFLALYTSPNATSSVPLERMRITSAGNVGIGTTAPSVELEVNGTISATAKSFNIPHPLYKDKRLVHGSLEGPEHGIYIRGTIEATEGCVIELPEYWQALCDEYTVQLTPHGPYTVFIQEKQKDKVMVASSSKDYKFDYFIVGKRTDEEFEVVQDA